MKPMHQLPPAAHAAMGWAHGAYRDGLCLALARAGYPDLIAQLIAQANIDGDEYIDLTKLPEYRG